MYEKINQHSRGKRLLSIDSNWGKPLHVSHDNPNSTSLVYGLTPYSTLTSQTLSKQTMILFWLKFFYLR